LTPVPSFDGVNPLCKKYSDCYIGLSHEYLTFFEPA
jgi:hypothetical protein